MTDAAFKEARDILVGSFGRVTRHIAEWHDFADGKRNTRPTVELHYLFRPGSILVKDTLGLIGGIAADKEGKDNAKNRLKELAGLIKPVVSALDGFITVPTVKITADVDAVRRLFDLIHERLSKEMISSKDGRDLSIPNFSGDHKAYKIEIKKLAHRLSEALIDCGKLPQICDYSQARDYIISCSRGNLYSKQCKVIQDAMESYRWKRTSMLTFCKGGSVYDKKTNDKRQTKISKKKRLVAKDLKDAWHDGVA